VTAISDFSTVAEAHESAAALAFIENNLAPLVIG
jgi:hypothetical protein